MSGRMAHEGLHEPAEVLSEPTRDMHRALISLIEELEAIDWYQQRAEACSNAELRSVLLHNKDEEIEHAAMTLEWIRRTSPAFDENLRTYLNSSGPITEIEAGAEVADGAAAPTPRAGGADGSLGIGSLKEP
jgi:uncharacterized protein